MAKKFKTIRVSEEDHKRLLKIKKEEYITVCRQIELMLDRREQAHPLQDED